MLHDYEYQLVDRRNEIKEWEKQHRPFPPRSGSVSKGKKSLEPEPEDSFWQAKYAPPGTGKKINMVFSFSELSRQIRESGL
jgi:hypothetical protein